MDCPQARGKFSISASTHEMLVASASFLSAVVTTQTSSRYFRTFSSPVESLRSVCLFPASKLLYFLPSADSTPTPDDAVKLSLNCPLSHSFLISGPVSTLWYFNQPLWVPLPRGVWSGRGQGLHVREYQKRFLQALNLTDEKTATWEGKLPKLTLSSQSPTSCPSRWLLLRYERYLV